MSLLKLNFPSTFKRCMFETTKPLQLHTEVNTVMRREILQLCRLRTMLTCYLRRTRCADCQIYRHMAPFLTGNEEHPFRKQLLLFPK